MKKIVVASERHSGIEKIIDMLKDEYRLTLVDSYSTLLREIENADMVIVDTALPGIGNLKEMVHTFSLKKGVPVLLYGLKEDDPEAGAALAAGAVDYLVYPVGKKRLLSVVRTVLDEEKAIQNMVSIIHRAGNQLRQKGRTEETLTLLKFIVKAAEEMLSSRNKYELMRIIGMLVENLGWKKGAVFLVNRKMESIGFKIWGVSEDKNLRKEIESPEIWRKRLSKEYSRFRIRIKGAEGLEFYHIPVEKDEETIKKGEDKNLWIKGDKAYVPVRDVEGQVMAIIYLIEPEDMRMPGTEKMLPFEVMVKFAARELKVLYEYEELDWSRENIAGLYEKLTDICRSSVKLIKSGDAQTVLKTIIESAKQMGWKRVFAFLSDPRFSPRVMVETGYAPEEWRIFRHFSDQNLWKKRFEGVFEKYRIGDFYYIPWMDEKARNLMEFSTEKEDMTPVEGWHTNDFIYTPITTLSGEVIGVVVLDSPEHGKKPQATELEPLSIIIHIAGAVIERILYEMDKDVAIRMMKEFLEAVAKEEPVETVMKGFLKGLRTVLSMDEAEIWLYDRMEREWLPFASSGKTPTPMSINHSLPLTSRDYSTVADHVIQTGKTIIIHNAKDSELPDDVSLSMVVKGSSSLIALPLRKHDGEIFGVLQLMGKDSLKISGFSEDFITHLSDIISLYLERLMIVQTTRQVVQNIKDVIFIAEDTGRIGFITPSFYAFTEKTTAEIKGDNILDYIIKEEDRSKLRMALRRCITAGETIHDMEVSIRKKEHTVPLLVDLSPIQQWGKRRVLGVMRDLSSMREKLESISQREKILQTVAGTGNILQRKKSQDALPLVLENLGRATGVSRVYLFENRLDERGRILTYQRYEWCADGVEPQIDNPELQGADMEEMGFGRWLGMLESGRQIYGVVKDFPISEQPLLESQQIKSILVSPIGVDGKLWGFIGFDDTEVEKVWGTVERNAIAIAASFIGITIEREEKMKRVKSMNSLFWTMVQWEDAMGSVREIQEMMEKTCFILSRFRGYSAVWIEEWSGKKAVKTQCCEEKELLKLCSELHHLDWLGRKAFNSGKKEVIQISHLPPEKRIKELLIEKGITHAISIPITGKKGVFATLNVLSVRPFMAEEIFMLDAIVRNIGRRCSVSLH